MKTQTAIIALVAAFLLAGCGGPQSVEIDSINGYLNGKKHGR